MWFIQIGKTQLVFLFIEEFYTSVRRAPDLWSHLNEVITRCIHISRKTLIFTNKLLYTDPSFFTFFNRLSLRTPVHFLIIIVMYRIFGSLRLVRVHDVRERTRPYVGTYLYILRVLNSTVLCVLLVSWPYILHRELYSHRAVCL